MNAGGLALRLCFLPSIMYNLDVLIVRLCDYVWLLSLTEETSMSLGGWRAPTTLWETRAPTLSPLGCSRSQLLEGSILCISVYIFPTSGPSSWPAVREQDQAVGDVCVMARHACMCGWPCWHIPMLSLTTGWTREHGVMATWPLSGHQVCQPLIFVNPLHVIRLLLAEKVIQYSNSKVFYMFSK